MTLFVGWGCEWVEELHGQEKWYSGQGHVPGAARVVPVLVLLRFVVVLDVQSVEEL